MSDDSMNKSLLVIIAVIVVVAISVFAVSPYFTETTVDEAIPTGAITEPKMEDMDAMMIKDDSTMKKDKMMEEETIMEEETMMEEETIMEEETMMEEETVPMSYAGTFIGVGDGIHDAQGDTYTIPLKDEVTY